MFYNIFDVIKELFFGATAVIEATSYEYWLLTTLTAIICILVVYAPFAVVRWFFRGL